MRLPLPCRVFAGVGVGQTKLLMVLWVVGERERRGHAQGDPWGQ